MGSWRVRRYAPYRLECHYRSQKKLDDDYFVVSDKIFDMLHNACPYLAEDEEDEG